MKKLYVAQTHNLRVEKNSKETPLQ